MANDLTSITDKILARGLLALRENAFMPLIVTRDFEPSPGEKGSTVDVPIPSAVAVDDVTPAATPPTTADQTPTSIAVPLDQWKHADFHLSDKDRMEIRENDAYLPGQASEAIKAIANTVNSYLLGFYKKFYGFAGVAGTTPFASGTTEATDARKALNNQLAAMEPRYMVIDPDAEGNALNLRAFQDASFAASADAIINGQIGRKLGFGWMMHQLVPSHTPGTATAKTVTVTDANAIGDKTLTLDVDSATGTLVEGDIITFAGHTQTYVVTALVTLTTSGVATSIEPGLKVAVDGSGTPVAVTIKAAHVANLALHRDAIAFATRPLQSSDHPSSVISSMADPLSGLVLRLEVTRQHKRDNYSFDLLYGAQVIRREFGARVAG